MALRLQSNLLYVYSLSSKSNAHARDRYGISRVYDQQCSYVLVDAQAAQVSIRGLLKISRTSGLDANAGKAK